jgi:hypothetical protein
MFGDNQPPYPDAQQPDPAADRDSEEQRYIKENAFHVAAIPGEAGGNATQLRATAISALSYFAHFEKLTKFDTLQRAQHHQAE